EPGEHAVAGSIDLDSVEALLRSAVVQKGLPRGEVAAAQIYSALVSPPGGSAPQGQTFHVQLGHAPGHEIGDDAGGAAGHGPAHVAVAAIEEEVAVAAEAEDGRAVWRHGAEAGAILAALVVDGVGKDVAREAQDVVEVTRRPAPVV